MAKSTQEPVLRATKGPRTFANAKKQYFRGMSIPKSTPRSARRGRG